MNNKAIFETVIYTDNEPRQTWYDLVKINQEQEVTTYDNDTGKYETKLYFADSYFIQVQHAIPRDSITYIHIPKSLAYKLIDLSYRYSTSTYVYYVVRYLYPY